MEGREKATGSSKIQRLCATSILQKFYTEMNKIPASVECFYLTLAALAKAHFLIRRQIYHLHKIQNSLDSPS